MQPSHSFLGSAPVLIECAEGGGASSISSPISSSYDDLERFAAYSPGERAISGADAMTHFRCTHRMPFGPCLADESDPTRGYRFRLWAPQANQIDVVLIDVREEKRYHACTRSGGWHHCRIATAMPGDRYLFRLPDGSEVQDPASRYNPDGVDGASELTAPDDFSWDIDWCGRRWEETVIYEMHIGAFTPEGDYASAETRLDELADLGATAIELMPVADFPFRRGRGYDVVLPFAPKAAYGRPDELKHFVQAAHRRGMMVFLDVSCACLGAQDNALRLARSSDGTVALACLRDESIDSVAAERETVRQFFIHNALYWLEEFRFDGLRIDAARVTRDAAYPDVLTELSQRVRTHFGARRIHLMLERADNNVQRLGFPGELGGFEAQWNGDFHRAAHTLLAEVGVGGDAGDSARAFERFVHCLAQGVAVQRRFSRVSGEKQRVVPISAFVNYLHNPAQMGGRSDGGCLATAGAPERQRAMVALQLLCPSTPLVFMGEESGEITPFSYFCDEADEGADALPAGLRYAPKPAVDRADPVHLVVAEDTARAVPWLEPHDETTLPVRRLDWAARGAEQARGWFSFYRRALDLRRRFVLPLLPWLIGGCAEVLREGERAFEIRWPTIDGFVLVVRANLSDRRSPRFDTIDVSPFAAFGDADTMHGNCRLGPWSVCALVLPAVERSE